MIQTWTVNPKLPLGAHNMRVTVVGEMTTSGDLIELNGIQVTFEVPDPDLEEKPLPLHGVDPSIYPSEDGKYWIVHYPNPKGSMQFYGTTKQGAIIMANGYVKRLNYLHK